jgi:hypothetical protein
MKKAVFEITEADRDWLDLHVTGLKISGKRYEKAVQQMAWDIVHNDMIDRKASGERIVAAAIHRLITELAEGDSSFGKLADYHKPGPQVVE